MARKRLVIGNWKMYVESLDEALSLARMLKRKAGKMAGVDVVVAPPAPFIAAVSIALASSPIRVGAQSVAAAESAHTGGVSARMARSAGAQLCLVGHSERRAAGDSDQDVHRQLVAAASAGLVPVLCVGELERADDGSYVGYVEAQLRSALAGAAGSLSRKLIVAYEPVWAIGKSASGAMKPADVQQMSIFIRKTLADILGRAPALRVPILYGGAVEPDNVAALVAEGGVGGFLVGHASVQIDQFIEILNSCRH